MSDDDGFNLAQAIETGKNAAGQFTEFLGIRREQHVCPECNVACEESTTYNHRTAAFDGGACPSWECPECGKHYIRERNDEQHTLDLYGQGRE